MIKRRWKVHDKNQHTNAIILRVLGASQNKKFKKIGQRYKMMNKVTSENLQGFPTLVVKTITSPRTEKRTKYLCKKSIRRLIQIKLFLKLHLVSQIMLVTMFTVNNVSTQATTSDNVIITNSGFIVFPKRPINGTKNSKVNIATLNKLQ